jgi:hypothetical protein
MGNHFLFQNIKKIQNRVDDIKTGVAKTSTSEQVLNRILKR